MEIGAHVWLRKESSHWGWVPAVVTRKDPITVRGVELINLTLTNDVNIESTMPPSKSAAKSKSFQRSKSQYYGDQEEFQVVITVDPEQLKSADHDDIKLRNLPNSFHFSGEDPEAGVIASPSTHTDTSIVGGVDDLIGLTHLHEPAILHALRLRYDADIIYTSTGPILIAVNPFKKMDALYSQDTMEAYRMQGENNTAGSAQSFTTPFKRRLFGSRQQSQQTKRLSPHVYQTADDAYRAMMRGIENTDLVASPRSSRDNSQGTMSRECPTNQSILVSGESGAGKTVTTKIVLNYFAMLSRKRAEMTRSTPSKMGRSPTSKQSDKVSIEQQVLQSNPILESFGNARTMRNDNSSRFGKYIDIRFTKSGKLSGASIETYLLEKVRLIHPGSGERNYHIFYQFLASASQEERREYYLGDMRVDDFKLLSQTGTFDRRDGVSDIDNHYDMLEAMSTMGFSGITIHSLLRLVVGVLFAGNITFTPSRDGESCRLDETDAALACAELLGIKFNELADALTARVILAGDEIVHKPLDTESATKALEAMIKAVYGAAFDFIVEKVNESIVDESSSSGSASIGVLDIFGFETFETNSFEQLCINYTNEALQQQFNRYVFKLEQQEYEREGIIWKFIAFPDNQDVLDLIDKKHTGVLALLDEQCILPRSTDEKYTRYLYAKCDKHPRFSASSSQRVDYVFSIEHYAGFVEYSTDSWIEKNKDQLPAAASDLLKSSTFDFISDIQPFVRGEDRAGRGTVATKSVSNQFSAQLRVLRSRIDETVPHYIRCLKPNDELAPHYFEPKNVVEQLRCGGVLEAVRVSRAGYPTRYAHDVFLARYYILGNGHDLSPQSPLFTTGRQDEKDTQLKSLIASIAFDLWYAEHQVMLALLSAEQLGALEDHGHKMNSQKGNGRNWYSKKFKMHAGPQAPPFSLAVESTMKTPEGKKKNKSSRDKQDRHNVVRPETVDEFKSLDFASRCAVAGLQLGRTKVFLRREAFDRIESMRSDKFFYAASAIQSAIRGKLVREHYKLMRWAAIAIQSVIRMKLSSYKVESVRYHQCAIKIQSAYRCYSARMWLGEVTLARRYAATIIQRAYRMYAYRTYQPDEDDIIRAVTVVQAMHRGGKVRKMLAHAALDDIHNKAVAKALSPPIVKHHSTALSPIPRASPPRQAPRHLVPSLKQSSEVTPYTNEAMSGALFNEIQNENWAMVESILDKYPELAEAADVKTGELALHKIARHNNAWTLLIDMVLVLYPKALIHRDNMGALPLHHAAAHDNLAAMEIIYSAYKEGINEVDKMGRLPIHVAATYDAVDAIKFLLAKSPEGAYTMVYRPSSDSGGGLPLHIACSNHASIGVVTALLAENFASAKRTDENGDLPLHLLLRGGEAVDPVVVKTLLTCFSGALSRTDMHGDLPLAISIKCQCRSAVVNAVLMQHPEAAGVLNGDGHSPLFLAFKHNADDRTLMGLLNHAPDLATAVDRKTGLLPIQVATENEHSHFIVHNLLKRDLPIDMAEKVRAQLVPHHYSWNHVVSNTDDLYHQVVTKVLQACTQPQVLALAHVEGPDGSIALASATPVCKHEMRVMLRLFNTLEVVNQRPAYTNPVSDTQIFYALRYDPPQSQNGQFTILHEEKKEGGENDYLEEFDDHSVISGVSRHSVRSTLTSRSQVTIEDKLRHIRKEKGQQVIAKLTSRSDIVERELKIRKDYHLSRHYVPAIISVHHTVQHAAYSEAMAEPGYCITMEGADTTAENLMLDMRKSGKRFPVKALKRIGISLLHMHEHGIVHADFGTHNIGKFGSRWKLLGVGGSVPIGELSDPARGFYHPPESIVVEQSRVAIGSKNNGASVVPVRIAPTFDIWAYGVVLYEAIAGVPLTPYACRGKRAMNVNDLAKIGSWDEQSITKALRHIPDDDAACDLIFQLLQPDPANRIPSMRSVLEHPFFTGNSGGLPMIAQAKYERVTPTSVSSSPSRNSFSKARLSHDSSIGSSNSNAIVTAPMPPPAVKTTSSAESIENRENHQMKKTRNPKRVSDPESPSVASGRSNRSFGGFRKLRTSLRRHNAA